MTIVSNDSSTMRLLGSGRAFRADLLALMEEVELLADLGVHELELLAPHIQAYEADSGCLIFSEGDPGHYMCLLVRGRVKTYKEAEAESQAEVANERRGRCIGEMALIDGEPRSATCVAVEPSLLLTLTQAEFQRLCDENSALALKLLLRISKLMSRRLRMTSGRLVGYLEA